ncbi:transglutaminase domain-containing protein [bacterium]|nr:transglutaminase domain-containing protein [bacterium]
MGDTLLYLTSLGVTLSGVFSYYSVVESNVIRIPTLLFILNGHLVSFLLRENKKKRLYSSFFLFSLLLLLFIDVFKGKGLLLFPPEAGGELGLIIGNFLLWLVVLRSYTLFSPGYLLFSIVPSVAFLGLISAYTVDPELFLYTSLCFLFSILLLIFNSYEIERFFSLRSTLFTMGLFLFLLSVLLAFYLFIPLQKLSSALPTPQVYIRLKSFQRSNLYENPPFLPNAVLLGGGLPRGNEIVLELKGEPTPLLRQGTYEYFTGRYWVKYLFSYTQLNGKNGVFSISQIKPRFSQVRQELSLKEVPVSLAPPIFGFFGPFTPPPFTGRRLYLLTPPNPCEILFKPDIAPLYILKGIDNSLSAVFFTREKIHYEVISQPDLAWQEPFTSSIYLQKPPSQKTGELAKSITKGLKNDYQKAIAIQEYLKKNYSYRLTGSPSPIENAVEWFLFKSKKGDCDFFASAMCILLREVGIPARVAVGYSVSEYDPKRDVWIVRQKDAHMWVEAYIKGQGWLTFDPTPAGGSSLYYLYLSLQRYYALHKRKIFPLFLFLASIYLLFLLYRATILEEKRKKKKGDIKEKLALSLIALGKKLERMGLPARRSSHTLREWFREISPHLSPSFREMLGEIINICEEAFYGRDVEEKKINLALNQINELRKVKRWQIIKTSTS